MYPDQDYASSRGSFAFPVDPPTVDPDASPTLTLSVACAWLPYIRGALYQLLLQATWKTDPAGLALVQARVFNLIDLFVECASSELPFACPWDFLTTDQGFTLFPGVAGFVPLTRGAWAFLSGWNSTGQTYSGGTCNTDGIAISKTFPSTLLTEVDFTYDLFKGAMDDVGGNVSGIVIRLAGSTVATQLVGANTLSDGAGQNFAWSGSVTADEVILVLADQYTCVGGAAGSCRIYNAQFNGTGTPPC